MFGLDPRRVDVISLALLLFYNNGIVVESFFSPTRLPARTCSRNGRFGGVAGIFIGKTNSKGPRYMSIDYEFIPPGSEGEEYDDDEASARAEMPPLDMDQYHHRRFTSSYEPGTPSGLRGEAVRSALRSGRCITWQPHGIGGALRIHGSGTLEFLNNKLTRPVPPTTTAFRSKHEGIISEGAYYEACLLTSSGRTIDRLRIAVIAEDAAIVLTSPGHSSKELLERLDPFIFPMDQVKLSLLEEPSTTVISLASTQWDHVQDTVQKQVVSKVMDCLSEDDDVQEPFLKCPGKSDECYLWCGLKMNDRDEFNVLVLPSTGFPAVACVGYTFIIYPSDPSKESTSSSPLGSLLWDHLIDESNIEGPIHVGAAEYENLRIEAGVPAFDCEIGGRDVDKRKMASPQEISQPWFDETVRPDQGCYLGQESVAAMRNNRRGPPRSLYRVVFDDEDNMYESQTRGAFQSRKSSIDNQTRPPKPGDKLCVLGSNEEIEVGTITSVAEPAGTGRNTVVGLALVRRADSVLKKMDARGIDRPVWYPEEIDDETGEPIRRDGSTAGEGSEIIMPPPLDPLENLEVIIKGAFTIGSLKMLPTRSFPRGKNMFDDNAVIQDLKNDALIGPNGLVQNPESDAPPPVDEKPPKFDDDIPESLIAEAEAARKAAKMKLLQERAAEATARRKAKANEAKMSETLEEDSLDAAAAEAKRKEEKMKLLKQRAEEAMARRRQKQKDVKS